MLPLDKNKKYVNLIKHFSFSFGMLIEYFIRNTQWIECQFTRLRVDMFDYFYH